MSEDRAEKPAEGGDDEGQPSLGSEAISGGRWGAVRSVALQVGTLVITGVLARLLSTEDFGLVAIAVVVVTMFDLLTRVGFGASVIRRPVLDREIASTLFWAASGIGLLAAGLAMGLSRPAAALAGSADAAGLVVLAAVNLPLGMAFSVVQGLILRDLRFRTAALVDVGGTVVHGVVAISLAFAGFGPWSIVIGQVARTVVGLVACLVITRFVPLLRFDRSVLAEDLSFGLGVLGGDVVSYVNRNADYWFVGNRLGPGPLGVYYVAFIIPNLLRQRFNGIGHEVLYPVVSKFQDDIPRITSAYLRVVRLVSFLVLPVMVGLAVVADLAIRIGFGPGWEEAVQPMQVISVGMALTAVGVVARPIFVAMGRPGITIVTGLLAVVTLGAAFGVLWGRITLVGVAVAVVLAAAVETVATQVYVVRILRVSPWRQLRAVAPFALATLVMAGVVVGVRATAVGRLGFVLEAVVAVAAGALAYLVVGSVGFRRDFGEQVRAVRSFLGLG